MTETTNVSDNPVVQTAEDKALEAHSGEGITLSTGVRVRLLSVSASLIDEVRTRIPDPDVPFVYDEEKEKKLYNPNHPDYLRGLEETENRRNVATTDCMIMFGVELLDGLPDDTDWVDRLTFMGIEIDTNNKLAVEFAYKKYIAVGARDLSLILSHSTPTGEEVERAMRGFRGDEEGGTDS